jgi:hypothetical protein
LQTHRTKQRTKNSRSPEDSRLAREGYQNHKDFEGDDLMPCENCGDGEKWWELVAWSFYQNMEGETKAQAFCPDCKIRYVVEVKDSKEML